MLTCVGRVVAHLCDVRRAPQQVVGVVVELHLPPGCYILNVCPAQHQPVREPGDGGDKQP